MGCLFAGVRAPSTLGSFLRSFTHGHVKQLHAVARRFLPALARHTPLLPGADQVAHVDIDDTIRRTYGYAKQGAGYGYSKVKGLNALLGIVSTPLSAPVIAATRLRKEPSNYDTWRYHAAFTDSPLSLKDAERDHRLFSTVHAPPAS
jgi:hypothetical protein